MNEGVSFTEEISGSGVGLLEAWSVETGVWERGGRVLRLSVSGKGVKTTHTRLRVKTDRLSYLLVPVVPVVLRFSFRLTTRSQSSLLTLGINY